ncbi:sensor histidine kinase [Pseudomonas eucalypticola]|uniref:histidine kinase n=1 Tax=Pseudomonas eucalypticola TaxID=2599595 RepID=A0A7D5H503_9PSED|nr:HAMP domain-containing sensor histidine kinase [Pseudomonas eucalypticola]QKZ04169.1 HAMP domain-containing histidine kinase [Pseudomonas eucalypticola]
MALNAVIFWGAASYLARQGDEIVQGQARALKSVPLASLPEQIRHAQLGDLRNVSYYGLFSEGGEKRAGNVEHLPADLPIDGKPRELKEVGFQYGARALALRLADNTILVVGYDAKTLTGLRLILVQTLGWSSLVILLMGLALGALLGLGPMRRVRQVQETSSRIATGDLQCRLPIAGNGDELDILSSLVNQMIGEVARLLDEVKSVGDNVAHDLRTPLHAMRAQLHRTLEQWQVETPVQLQVRVEQALAAADSLLSRFRALQRIAEIDKQQRLAGMADFALEALFEELAESYGAVAEETGITLRTSIELGSLVHADRALVAEALINLLENALKFTGEGGTVWFRLQRPSDEVVMLVEDNGPGIAEEDRERVLHRFGRSARDQHIPGAGLGLAMVSAVARLHGYQLTLDEAAPGLRVTLRGACRAADSN